MPSCLMPYLYFVLSLGTIADLLKQTVKAFHAVCGGEYICEDSTLRADDEAVMLVQTFSFCSHVLRLVTWIICEKFFLIGILDVFGINVTLL